MTIGMKWKWELIAFRKEIEVSDKKCRTSKNLKMQFFPSGCSDRRTSSKQYIDINIAPRI